MLTAFKGTASIKAISLVARSSTVPRYWRIIETGRSSLLILYVVLVCRDRWLEIAILCEMMKTYSYTMTNLCSFTIQGKSSMSCWIDAHSIVASCRQQEPILIRFYYYLCTLKLDGGKQLWDYVRSINGCVCWGVNCLVLLYLLPLEL